MFGMVRSMSSPAEERIRLKVEAGLRAVFPDARIVHELVVRQGACRIDLAAITATRLIVAEVKSERDVLTRLERQTKQALEVADGFLVVTVEKHLEKARKVAGWHRTTTEDDVIAQLERAVFRETNLATTNAPARLDMLWAAELRAIAGFPARSTRAECIRQLSNHHTGEEIRKGVCAALRARAFPRADPPILSDLFQRPSEFRA